MDGLSMDVERTELENLKKIFPRCFIDGQLSVTKLMEACGEFETVDENDREKYEFRWKGKQEAQQLAGKRSAGALRPCPEESVNWEQTQNLYIEGDNLEVLKILQRTYFRKVKMIYIDPPYNTGNDFVYNDDFADPLARYREITSQTTKSNPEAMGRFHTNWLNMMYPRLRLAANLLRDDGVIFISIDDNEVANLRKLCDEIFGEENFFACVSWHKNYASANDAKRFSNVLDYILIYQKSEVFSRNLLPRTDKQNSLYKYDNNDGKGRWRPDNLSVKTYSANYDYPIINPNTGVSYNPPQGRCWMSNPEKIQEWIIETRVFFGQDGKGAPQLKRYLNEVQQGVVPTTYWSYDDCGHNDLARKEIKALFEQPPFDTPKPTALIKQMLAIGTQKDDDDIIMDFFSGSATTAHAIMQLNAENGGNRQFIMVQLPEVTDEKSEAYKAGYKNICEIGKERIRRAGGKIASELEAGQTLPDIGFRVFKLDSSNLKIWDDSPISGDNPAEQLEIRLREMLDIIKPDRSELDIVYEIMLKLGQELTKPVIPLDINGKTVYGVGTGNGNEVKFIICFAPGITPEDAESMAEYAPGRIIFANACFSNTEEKTNVKLTLKDKGIAMKAL